MKTYYEMTESVLEKARADVLKKERRRRNGVFIAASGLCAVLLLTAIGAGLKQTPTVIPTLPGEQPGISMDATAESKPVEQQVAVKVAYLSDMEGQTSQKLVSPDVSIPLGSKIWVRDIRGLTEEEVDQVRQEVMAEVSEFILAGNSNNSKWEYPGAIAVTVCNGGIVLDFSDSPTVKNIDIETTDMGLIVRTGSFDVSNRGDHSGGINWAGVKQAGFYWTISGELAVALHHDPTIPLESIRDTVTIAINYTNGTEETLVFDITVNEEGQIFATQRGIPTVAA